MLSWSIRFLIIAIVAGALGLTGVAGTAAEIAKTLFVIFLGLFVLSLVMGVAAGDWLSHHWPGGHHLGHR